MTLAFLSLLSAPVLGAPGPCAGYKVSDDKFGTGSSVEAVVQLITQFTPVSLIFQVKSGQAELLLTVKEAGAISAGIAAGVEVPFVLEDGTVLKLQTIRETATKPYATDSAVMTMMPYSLGLTAADVSHFATSPLDAARLPLSSGPYDWEANKGVQKAMMKAAVCVKEHVAAPSTTPPATDPPTPQ